MMATELTATSRQMLDQTYGHLYKSEAVAASKALLKASEVFYKDLLSVLLAVLSMP